MVRTTTTETEFDHAAAYKLHLRRSLDTALTVWDAYEALTKAQIAKRLARSAHNGALDRELREAVARGWLRQPGRLEGAHGRPFLYTRGDVEPSL